MTKAEEREVIIETLQYELIERFDTNIEYYSENIAKKPKKFDKKLDKLDQYLLVDYLQHLIDDRLDHLIKKYFLVVVDGELDFDLIEPIYVEYRRFSGNANLFRGKVGCFLFSVVGSQLWVVGCRFSVIIILYKRLWTL